ncbi:MAG: hypothetical protein DRN15_04345 [Thermoprotei archaeon]|nr:MAG: hypothetical protein DRN15_04345 [Thermoprotei archaeon]
MHGIARALKAIVQEFFILSQYDRILCEAPTATQIVASNVLPLVSKAMRELRSLLCEKNIKESYERLSKAYAILSSLSRGEVPLHVMKGPVTADSTRPAIALDEAHHLIHEALDLLSKTSGLEPWLRETIEIVSKARRDTHPMVLYRTAMKLLKNHMSRARRT